MKNEEQELTDAQLLRRNAEKNLRETQNSTTTAELETDIKRLVHELQVHQIELEMQNEELKAANESVEQALKKYTMMYDFAPVGYFTLNPDAKISELNFTAAELLGERRFSLINSNFKLFVSEESLPAFNNFLRIVYLGKSKESCEINLGHDSNHLRNVYLDAIVIGEDDKCLLTVVDISALKMLNKR